MKINNNKLKSLILLSLVGSASTNEEKPTSQSELTLNSLPQMGVNFTKRGNETDPIFYVFAGYPIFIEDDSGANLGNCTLGFAVNIVSNNNDMGGWCKGTGDAFITSVRCCQKHPHCFGYNVFLTNYEKKINTGIVHYSTYTDTSGWQRINFDFFEILMPRFEEDRKKIKFIPYVAGKENNMYPVIGLGVVELGGEVCAYGSVNGYLCGKLVETGSSLEQNQEGTIYTFAGMNKVDLGEGHGFDSERDLGGSVYVTNTIGERTTAQALGYISGVDNSDLNHKFFYYTPLSAFIDYAKVLNDDWGNCAVELITYNENNTQEYDQLLAQMEIPINK